MSGLQGNWRKRITSAFPSILKAAGVALLVAGLQAWGFHRYFAPGIDTARQNLTLLQQEVSDNELMNAALAALRDYWRIATDEVRKRQAAALRETVVTRFKEQPRVAVEEFVRVASAFEPPSGVEQEVLATLQQNLLHLQAIYADHYGEAIARYTGAPWYLQPGAALFQAAQPAEQMLLFNHALYLMLIGDRSTASEIFNELRRHAPSEEFKSRVLFAQARLQYDAYRVEPNLQYYDDAVQYVQQSVRSDPGYDLPKLFLEFLLSFDQQALEIDSTPAEGVGTGEAQGERGAISTDSEEF